MRLSSSASALRLTSPLICELVKTRRSGFLTSTLFAKSLKLENKVSVAVTRS
jgi:hypothetical protein